MNEALDVINAFATPLKVAWVVWLAWGVGQYFWFRHERAGASAAPVVRPAMTKPLIKRPAAAKPAPAVAETPVMGRLITPQHVAAEPKIARQAPVAAPAPVVPVFDAPAFDPSTAVIETFSPAPNEGTLDKFVADFDRQDPRPLRRSRALPADAPSYGVEAPHTP
jgi:hypothetical protein